jgi:hypothetical protein
MRATTIRLPGDLLRRADERAAPERITLLSFFLHTNGRSAIDWTTSLDA